MFDSEGTNTDVTSDSSTPAVCRCSKHALRRIGIAVVIIKDAEARM